MGGVSHGLGWMGVVSYRWGGGEQWRAGRGEPQSGTPTEVF